MSLQSDFKNFLSDIEPSPSTVERISTAHNALRNYLENHEEYSEHCVSTYLSGSYAKHTAIRPAKDDDKRDVDIVIETDFTTSDDAFEVIEALRDVLLENANYSSAKIQSHSVGIELATLDMDVVPLASVSESYYIGNSEDGSWKQTNPKGHKEWSTDFNKAHFEKYKPVVKIVKWWRREHCPEGSRWPKGITLEKIIADNFPDDDAQYDNLLISLFQSISDSYEDDLANGIVPVIEDPSLPSNDLADSYEFDDFKAFVNKIKEHLDLIFDNGSDNETWRTILGSRFPSGECSSASSLALAAYYPIEKALAVSHRKKLPWDSLPKRPSMHVTARIDPPGGDPYYIHNNDEPIPKHSSIIFEARRSPKMPSHHIEWQIVNTGEEAQKEGQLRGEILEAEAANGSHVETSLYTGRHYVQCFAIRNNRCIAFSKEFFINIE